MLRNAPLFALKPESCYGQTTSQPSEFGLSALRHLNQDFLSSGTFTFCAVPHIRNGPFSAGTSLNLLKAEVYLCQSCLDLATPMRQRIFQGAHSVSVQFELPTF